MTRRNTRRRANDGYQSKVEFWTEQLALAKEGGQTRYTRERCEESLAYFKGKRAAYLSEQESAEERAIRKCRAAFEGLSESERLMKANRTIKDAAQSGITVNQTMAFLQKAGVMSDTELMHATQF
mgnify:CR=1 FL=1|tara:strand:+ start:213 stop:587 length:375 start_codon:yes stop_codon:yes gene_type:complete